MQTTIRAGAIAVAMLGLAAPARAELPAIMKRALVGASIAEVWRAFTTADGAKSFFAPAAKIELRLDGAYELYFDPTAKAGQRGSDGMRVLAFVPGRMLAFTWNAPPTFARARATRGPFVVVLLEPKGARQTAVTLHHLGWPAADGEWPAVRAYFERAWGVVLDRLVRRFREGRPVDWSKL
jgi:uncharacterized protein YndB with AHSA1/START domain